MESSTNEKTLTSETEDVVQTPGDFAEGVVRIDFEEERITMPMLIQTIRD